MGSLAPRPRSTPDPNYTRVAKDRQLQGMTVLWCVINEKGQVEEIRIARPLGLGLDDTAVAAVRNWKFDPAMQNGQPVTVQIYIEVNFRLD